MLPAADPALGGPRRKVFSVDAWDPGYGMSVPDGDLDPTTVDVDCAVETPPARWQPVTPPASAAASDRVAFVDGVRRTDARVWFSDGDLSTSAACASLAAGAVLCPPAGGAAEIAAVEVDRCVFAAAGSQAHDISTRYGDYRLVLCPDASPKALNTKITETMTALERRVAVTDAGLVVYDGPLRGRDDGRGVGYVKTQHVLYLPEQLHSVLGHLAAGQRTPLFRIGGEHPQARLSWYLRLPGAAAHPLAGVVRCELPPQTRPTEAAARADLVSATLPRFASQPHRDPRAPQNLNPIGGLEQHLRRRLGDRDLLLRGLQARAAQLARTSP